MDVFTAETAYSIGMKIGGVALLTAFLPVTGLTLRGYLANKKRVELRRLADTYRLHDTLAYRRVIGWDGDQSQSEDEVFTDVPVEEFITPVLFSSFLVLLGSTFLLLGREMHVAETPNLLFAGMHYGDTDKALGSYQQQSALVLGMAFIGAYVWSVWNVLRRIMTSDLTPGAFYSVSLRIIFASLIALTLHHFLDAVPDQTWGRDVAKGLLPVIAFLTGLFPERALDYMRDRIKIFRHRPTSEADQFPLAMIEGINDFKRIRLSEIGIDNAQNLATSNPIELVLKTPYKIQQIVDWTAQAQLFVIFKAERMKKLRDSAVRTVFDFANCLQQKEMVEELATTLEVSETALNAVGNNLEQDASYARLRELHLRLLPKGSDR